MSRARRVADELGPPLLGVAGLLVVWALIAAVSSLITIPSPLDAWRALRHGIADGTIGDASLRTLLRLGFSFAVSIVLGTAIGFGLSLHELTRRSIRPLIVALQIVPPIAVLPIAIGWFGFTERAVVFVAIVGSFPSIALATIAAFRQVPPILIRAGRTLGAEGWELYRSVVFPAALPGYVAGFQQAWGFAWKALLAGELIVSAGHSVGLGQLLAREQDRPPILFAALAVIVLVGVAVDYVVFGQLDRRVRSKRGMLA
jgi:NitT/TauT family transport system permease protein